jgi:CBS domain-containing protein
LDLSTDPEFSTVGIDAFVSFSLAPVKASDRQDGSTTAAGDTSEGTGATGSPATDPALYVGMLRAATREVVTVTRDSTVSEAVTKMMFHNYSQLPVTQDLRDIDGMISWRSIGVARTKEPDADFKYVRDCLDKDFSTVELNTPLLDAVAKIARDEVVLVLGRDRRITGIVTTSDLSLKYHELAAPFLLLQEIEYRLRLLIDDACSKEEIAAAGDPRDGQRKIEEAADLTFGEYIRLLEAPKHWSRLTLPLDRRVFVKLLRGVKDVRNEIMHFSPDDLSSENLDKIGKMRKLLEQLASTSSDERGKEYTTDLRGVPGGSVSS